MFERAEGEESIAEHTIAEESPWEFLGSIVEEVFQISSKVGWQRFIKWSIRGKV